MTAPHCIPPAPQSPVRWFLLTVLLAAAVGVGIDLRNFAAGDSPITALRTQPAGAAEEAGSVDAFCGFAPCGMPLECK